MMSERSKRFGTGISRSKPGARVHNMNPYGYEEYSISRKNGT
jgi:hypothetical protein